MKKDNTVTGIRQFKKKYTPKAFKEEKDNGISPCEHCFCVTHTFRGRCGKCGKLKEEK